MLTSQAARLLAAQAARRSLLSAAAHALRLAVPAVPAVSTVAHCYKSPPRWVAE